MDTLEVRLVPHNERWTAVELMVNNSNLADLVAAFERERGFEPAGGYAAINLAGRPPARARLTGEPDWDGRVVLLVCAACGVEGCWDMWAHVEMGPETVSWSGFRQGHRPAWDYSELHFEFDRSEYEGALEPVH